VLLRIDYSDDPGYWSDIVAARPGSKRKRDIEIETHFDGDHKEWLEAQWHIEKRSVPLEDLHKRWWSGNVREWLDRQKKVSLQYTGVRHRVADTITVPIYEQDLRCPAFGTDGFDDLFFKCWAELHVDISASAGVTLIGNLGDLTSFEESHAWFRSTGAIDATLNFQAKAALSFHTGPVELFGAQNFGATFRVPGIVTIGPNFRIIADLSGDATLEV
jgi:chitinase